LLHFVLIPCNEVVNKIKHMLVNHVSNTTKQLLHTSYNSLLLWHAQLNLIINEWPIKKLNGYIQICQKWHHFTILSFLASLCNTYSKEKWQCFKKFTNLCFCSKPNVDDKLQGWLNLIVPSLVQFNYLIVLHCHSMLHPCTYWNCKRKKTLWIDRVAWCP